MNNADLKQLLMDIPIKVCRNMNNQFVKSILKDLDINFSQQHYTVLKLLKEGKSLYVREFVEVLGITKPQMTALTDKLVKMGYVTRTSDLYDRRKVYISATKTGVHITSKIDRAIDNQVGDHLVKLSPQELDTLRGGLLVLEKLCLDCVSKNIKL